MGWLRLLALGLAALNLSIHVVAQSGDTDMSDAPPNTSPGRLTWPEPALVWDPVQKTCEGLAKTLGYPTDEEARNALLNEIILVANNAIDRMNSLEQNKGEAWYRYQTKAAYDLIFASWLPDSQDRWNSVKSSLQALASLTSAKYIYMMCDDAPLASVLNTETGKHEWKYPHNLDRVIQSDTPVVPNCVAKPGLIGYRTREHQWDADNPQYVILCGKKNSGDLFLSRIKVEAGKAIDMHTTLTSTLFHEFLHVLVPEMRGDMEGGTAEGGERYGLQGALEVRETYGPLNPDSVTLFALALALDEDWVWESGLAESEATHLARLKESPEGRKILRDWGFPGGEEPPQNNEGARTTDNADGTDGTDGIE